MLKIRLTLSTLIFLIGFNACKKEDLPDPAGTRLQMTISKWRDSLFYRSFKYDDQNRLTAILDSSNSEFKRRFFIDYDSQGRPVKVNEFHNNTFDGSFAEISFSFSYDDNGRLIKKLGLTPNGNQVQHTYGYDSKERLIADSMYSYWTNDIVSYTTYSYDANDNIIEKKEFEKGSGLMKNHELISYDNKRNPFKSLGLILYFIAGQDFTLNTNNRIQTKYEDGTIVNYDYEYYNNGLPKRFSEKDNTDPSVTYLDFSYE